jgi:hypothetical protein
MMMSNWHKHREFAETASAQGPYRGDCPFCGGKNTFSATQEYGTLKYNCYKLGCDVGGIFDTDMTAAEVRRHMRPAPEEAKKEPETMEIPAQLVIPTPQHVKHNRLMRRWGIVGGTYYDVQQERVVFPIYYKGRIIDAIGRAVGEKKHPKWYRYTGAADYYLVGSGDVIIVVEDVISAIVASQEFPQLTAMAILGTTMSQSQFAKIGEYNKVIIALDPDAIGKTIEFRRDIELWTGIKATAMSLHDDIKYRMPEDLEKLKELLS